MACRRCGHYLGGTHVIRTAVYPDSSPAAIMAASAMGSSLVTTSSPGGSAHLDMLDAAEGSDFLADDITQ